VRRRISRKIKEEGEGHQFKVKFSTFLSKLLSQLAKITLVKEE